MQACETIGMRGLLPMPENLTTGSLSCVNGCVTGTPKERLTPDRRAWIH
jgi:hypothetical protein